MDKIITKAIMDFKIDNGKLPTVSVIIPVLNRETIIEQCINCLITQTYPEKLIEIILIDNGSTDDTFKIISKLPIKAIKEKKKGPSAARNKGIIESKGTICLFIDSDCFAHQSLIYNHVKAHLYFSLYNPEIKLIGGGIAGYNENFWSYCDDICSWYLNHPNLPGRIETRHLPAANLSIMRETINKTGLFDTSLYYGEDIEFCSRVISRGYKIYFHPSAVVYHYNFTTFRDFINRPMRWSSDNYKLLLKGVNTKQGFNDKSSKTFLSTIFSYIQYYFMSIWKIIYNGILSKRIFIIFLIPFIILNKTIFAFNILRAEIKKGLFR